MYIFNGIFNVLYGVFFLIWWGPCLPLALAVFLLRLIGGDPDAKSAISDGASLVLLPAAVIGMLGWCAVVGILWYLGILERWVELLQG